MNHTKVNYGPNSLISTLDEAIAHRQKTSPGKELATCIIMSINETIIRLFANIQPDLPLFIGIFHLKSLHEFVSVEPIHKGINRQNFGDNIS